MNKNIDNNEAQPSVDFQDFTEFIETPNMEVPSSLTAQTMTKLSPMLYPSAKKIFAKIFSIHIVVGFLSLAVCHQFDMNPFNTKASLADIFMGWGGHSLCMVLCGVFFTSLSYVISNFSLSIEETRVLRQTMFAQISILLSLSLALFFIGGATLSATMVGLWALGAFGGGWLSIEGQYWLRMKKFQSA